MTNSQNDTRQRALGPAPRWSLVILCLMVLGYAVLFGTLSIQQHQSQLTTAFDMGIFDQLVWNIAQGRGMQRSIEITLVHWAVHSQPILFLLAPLYWVLPAPETLLVVQTVGLALCAVPLFLLAYRHTGIPLLSLLLAAAFLLSPAVEGMNLVDFHPVALAPLFLLWAFYFLETGNPGRFAVAAVLAISCKEDIALAIAMMGVYGFVVKRQRPLGMATFLAGLGWYALAVMVIHPHFSGGLDKQGWRYQQLAWPLSELIHTIVARPRVWIPYALQPAKRTYLLGLLWPFGFLPLLAPQVTIMALPALMINLLSSFAAQHEPDSFQYNAAIVPFLALGGIWATSWLLRWAKRCNRRHVGLLLGACLMVASLSYHRIYGYTPLAAHYGMTKCEHCETRDRLLTNIPPEASVSAQTTLVPHLSQRISIYEYPVGADLADYVLLDVTAVHHAIPMTDDYYASIDWLWQQQDVGLLAAEDGYLLFQRGADAPPLQALPASFYNYALGHGPNATPWQLDFGPIRLLDAELRLAREGWVEITLYWQALQTVPPSYRPSMAIGYQDGDLTAWHRQTLPYRWSQRGWQAGEVLRLTTGVSTGHGPDAGWKTGWVLYAGVVADANGAWLEPQWSGTRPQPDLLRVPIDSQEAKLVPVLWLSNTWGITRPAYSQRGSGASDRTQ